MVKTNKYFQEQYVVALLNTQYPKQNKAEYPKQYKKYNNLVI